MAGMSATDRKDFSKILERKADDLKKALNGDLFSDKEQMKQEALIKEGITDDPDKLTERIRDVDEDISTIVSEHMETMQMKKKHEKEDAVRTIKDEITTLEMEYNRKLSELKKKHAEAGQSIDIKYVDFEKTCAQEHCKKQLEEKKKLQDLKDKCSKIFLKVEEEIRDKQRMIKKFKFTIEQTIVDKYNAASEALVCAETREEAKKALESIPNIWELMNSCTSQDNLRDFIKGMSPQMVNALPGPVTEPVKPPEEAKVVEASVVEDTPELKQADAVEVESVTETTEEDVEAEQEAVQEEVVAETTATQE